MIESLSRIRRETVGIFGQRARCEAVEPVSCLRNAAIRRFVFDSDKVPRSFLDDTEIPQRTIAQVIKEPEQRTNSQLAAGLDYRANCKTSRGLRVEAGSKAFFWPEGGARKTKVMTLEFGPEPEFPTMLKIMQSKGQLKNQKTELERVLRCLPRMLQRTRRRVSEVWRG